MKSLIQMISFASTAAMYLASVVDIAKVFCSLDCHETTPLENIIMYLDVDLLVFAAADMSESVNPSNTGSPDPNQRHTVGVPFRY